MAWLLAQDSSVPPLPVPMAVGGADRTTGEEAFVASRSLPGGCYVVRLTPWPAEDYALSGTLSYLGTLRVEWQGSRVCASGDLYLERLSDPSQRRPPHVAPDDHPTGIPIHRRDSYRYYLRVVEIRVTPWGRLRLGFELHRHDLRQRTWASEGILFSDLEAQLPHQVGFPAPAGHAGPVVHHGVVHNQLGTRVAELELGWVSHYLRRARLEVDALEPGVSIPGGEDIQAAAVAWQRVFDPVGLHLEVFAASHLGESTARQRRRKEGGWSEAELHELMLERRGSVDLDREWRYYLICIETLTLNERALGIMFDYSGYGFDFDTNASAREGVAVAAEAVFRYQSLWGDAKGRRQDELPDVYFHTAVHELGHAMHLEHASLEHGLMRPGLLTAGAPGVFPSNLKWYFSEDGRRRLAHLPDPWVRPGGAPFGWNANRLASAIRDLAVCPDGVRLELRSPVTGSHGLTTLPLGCPLRLELILTGGPDVPEPVSLSLKSGMVNVTVEGPDGSCHPVAPIVTCIAVPEDDKDATDQPCKCSCGCVTRSECRRKHQCTCQCACEAVNAGAVEAVETSNEAGESAKGWARRATFLLLTGMHGVLFPVPGAYRVMVELQWWDPDSLDLMAFSATSELRLLIVDAGAEQLEALFALQNAGALIRAIAIHAYGEPEGKLLDHLLASAGLGPHYRAIVVRNRLERARNGDEAAEALEALGGATLITEAELERIAALLGRLKPPPQRHTVQRLVELARSVEASEELLGRLKELAGAP